MASSQKKGRIEPLIDSPSIPLQTLNNFTSLEDDIAAAHEQSASLQQNERLAVARGSHHNHNPGHTLESDDSDVRSSTGSLVDQLSTEVSDEHTQRFDSERDSGSSSRDEIIGPTKKYNKNNRNKKKQKRKKKVRYDENTVGLQSQQSHLQKKDIYIPDPGPRRRAIGVKLIAPFLCCVKKVDRMYGLTGKPLLYFTSIFVSLGVFLFGYDQGVMSGLLTGENFKKFFDNPTAAQIGTMVAILEHSHRKVGAFFSSLLVGKIGDIIGRRRTILYGAIIFVVGGAFQTLSIGMITMIIGRVIAGIGVGLLSTIIPVYQSEISPSHNRGLLACIEFTGNIVGYCSSVWMDYFCYNIPNDWSWRLPLSMQVVMGSLLAIGSLAICESPRWLLDNDHDEDGLIVLANLHGGGDVYNERVREEFRDIKENVILQRQEGERTYKDMFSRYSRRVFIAMSAQAFAQLNGINVISYYAPLVFQEAGWEGRDAILMTGINALVYVASSIPPWYLVDRWGRRKILLSGAIVMATSLSLISYFMYLRVPSTPTLVVVFVIIYNAFFGYSWGPIPWLYPPEILPLSIRAKGASLSTATNWAFNWLVGELTPILQETVKWRLYLIHAFFCLCSFVLVFFFYPETKGLTLEDMGLLFNDASAAPTPSGQSLLSSGMTSPVPTLDIDGSYFLQNRKNDSDSSGIIGWFQNLLRRGDRYSTDYRPLESGED
ncbi:hypothetical protein H072_786 [Dactylellina haptotyla CBS 200.50]|uniref:Major facilitator superfamily (MFS) profile domain-containing protein n=1 Tax=Dactylellina haptotyla (strain CBS 200.50) TaxID=1284197 RepID=S8C0E3_DACHA|nr:hypothetical protein H072_786 [Dactylellina haptotyla CBS 200.50]